MSRNHNEVRKLNLEELKAVMGGGGVVGEGNLMRHVPGMKYFPKRVPVHAKKMKK